MSYHIDSDHADTIRERFGEPVTDAEFRAVNGLEVGE